MKAQIIAAAGLLLTLRAHGVETIYSGAGFGTYYYDVNQTEACGTLFSDQNSGPVECSPATALSLSQIGSEYLVAMNHTQLIGDMAMYCGKKVIVSVNGQPSNLPLFIGDGCQRCGTGSASNDAWDPIGAPGLDFSYSVLSQLSSSACSAGHIDITWEIVDDPVYNFDTNGSGAPQGPVTGGGSTPTPEPAPEPAPEPSSSTKTAPKPTSPAEGVVPFNPVVPTTLVTITRYTTVLGEKSIKDSPTATNPSEPCPTGVWQCNGSVLEQCLVGSWAPRVTCAAGMTCQGGSNPYCAPPGFGQLAPPS